MNAIKKAPRGNRPRVARPNAVSGCPLTAALAAIGGKWKLIVVYWLAESPKHFAAIRRAMPGISPKVLAEQLQELVDDGIVEREPEGRVPARVVYSLTEYGRSVVPLVESVRLWGRAHIARAIADEDLPAGSTHDSKRGKFMSGSAARAGGNRPSAGKACS